MSSVFACRCADDQNIRSAAAIVMKVRLRRSVIEREVLTLPVKNNLQGGLTMMEQFEHFARSQVDDTAFHGLNAYLVSVTLTRTRTT